MQNSDKGQRIVKNVMRYSGIGFQLAASIGLGVFIGYELDKWMHTSKPYFALLFGTLFLGAGLYLTIKQLMQDK